MYNLAVYNTVYSHEEPPPFEPTYYQWNEFVPAYNNLLPGVIDYEINFYHPE